MTANPEQIALKENLKVGVDHLVLVAGLSGAGKSSALKFLEDLGYYWVDNLPLQLIPTYIEYFAQEGVPFHRMAIGIHIRNQGCLEPFQTCHKRLNTMVGRLDLIFLESKIDRVVSRYRETRRRHPLARNRTVREAIVLEMAEMEPVRAMADLVIDTTEMTVPQLKDRLDLLFQDSPDSNLVVFIRSFGFKFGVSTDADMVLDGRFLPNPYYDPQLRPLSGRDKPIIRFLEKDGEALVFLDRLQSLFDYLIPRYQKEKKRYFTIDIGCTGGRHRSVFLVDRLSERLSQLNFNVLVRHRDLDREGVSTENSLSTD